MKGTLESTNFNNVVRVKNDNQNSNNNKAAIDYGFGFNGEEELKWQPMPLEAYGRISRINSADLAKTISAHFKLTFHELKGCNLYVTPNGVISLELFFERNLDDLPSDKINSLDLITQVGSENKNNLYYKMQALNNRRNGKIYSLNNETKLLLSKFMYGGEAANKPNNNKVWESENYVKEIHIPNNDPFMRSYKADRVLVRVRGIDIKRVLRELYGSSMVAKTCASEDTEVNHYSTAQYEVRWARTCPDGTFILNIEQFDAQAVEKLYIRENPLPQNLGVMMY